jgi:hypothetical protein
LADRKNPLLEGIRENIARSIDVAFPTQGKFYHDGVMKEGVDYLKVTVRPLTINAETALRDPILLASGRAIPKMVQFLIPEVLDPEELCDIDIEVILLATRIASYGAILSLDHTCTNPAKVEDKLVCEKVNPLRINLIEHIQKFNLIEDWAPYQMEFPIEDTPEKKTKQIIHLRRLPYRAVLNSIRQNIQAEHELEPFRDKTFDELILSDEALLAYEKMSEIVSSTGVESLMESIVSVEMVTETPESGISSTMVYTNESRDMVREWLWAIPRDWITEMTTRINSFSQDLAEKNTIEYSCPGCKHKNKFQMQLDVNKLFFSESPLSTPEEEVSPTSTRANKSKSRARSKTLSR